MTRRPMSRQKAHGIDKEKRLDDLQKQCTELKCLINSTSEENLRNRTRLMTLDKELNKRERLLQTMLKLNHAGLGLQPEIVEKLREERNIMLPLYRKKAQDLQQQILERENDHKAMKRDVLFTRIIELQVEFVSWKQEAIRLDAMMAEEEDVVKKEIAVHEKRIQDLKQELKAVKDQQERIQGELEDEKAWHESSREQCEEKEEELRREQTLTREVAIQYKGLIQERKQAEKLQMEIEEMELDRKKDEEELEALQAGLSTGPLSARDRFTVTGAALSALPVMDEPGLTLLRRWYSRQSFELFQFLLLADGDQDGLLSLSELAEAMVNSHGCPLEPSEAGRLLFRLASRVSDDPEKIRWLDLLVLLERLGPCPCNEKLPELQGLRGACLRRGLCSEELLRQLQAIDSKSQAEALFGGSALALPPQESAAWVEAWQKFGSERLSSLLPMDETTRSEEAMAAWLSRVKVAAQKNREELQMAFQVWRSDMLLTPDQFKMVCGDVLGRDLSHEDIEDLLLLCLDPSTHAIDGRKLLEEFGNR